MSIAAGLLFGAAPAWRVTRAIALRGSPHIVRGGGGRLRLAFIGMQIALSTVLLAGSLMFIVTIRNLQGQDLGFRADHSLLVPVLAERGYRPNLSLIVPELLGRVSGIPGVSAATVAVGGTLGAIGGARVQVEGSSTADRLNAVMRPPCSWTMA